MNNGIHIYIIFIWTPQSVIFMFLLMNKSNHWNILFLPTEGIVTSTMLKTQIMH